MGLSGQTYIRVGDAVELQTNGLGRQWQTIGQA
jgi:hypothetical protein